MRQRFSSERTTAGRRWSYSCRRMRARVTLGTLGHSQPGSQLSGGCCMHESSNEREKCMCPMMLVTPPRWPGDSTWWATGLIISYRDLLRMLWQRSLGNAIRALVRHCTAICRSLICSGEYLIIVDDGRSGAITTRRIVACSAHPIAQENLGTPPLR
jgi:hypothetical protein